jgi:Ni2+-binding GTPase involved in maturation of urease and hydrogenase
MDKIFYLDVTLITKITELPIVGAQLEKYLDNKACEKETTEIVKTQFHTSRGNKGIVLRDINDEVKRFNTKLMD